MPSWVTLDAGNLPIVSSVSAITDQLATPLNAAAAAANAAAAVMTLLAAIAGAAVDPLGPIRGQINDLINDLVGSGVYGLVIAPGLFEKATSYKGPDGFLRVIKEAINDPGDTNRPPFDVGDTSGGIIFMVTSPSLPGLAELALGFQSLFGESWTDLISYASAFPVITPQVRFETSGVVTDLIEAEDARNCFIDSTQKYTQTQPNYDPYKGQLLSSMTGRNAGLTTRVGSFDNLTKTFKLNPGFRYPLEVGDGYAISYNMQSKPPDWKSYRVVDAVPITADVVGVLANIRDSLPVYGMSPQFKRLAVVLADKADLFTALAGSITDLVKAFDALDSLTGISMLPIPPQNGGNQGFMQSAFMAGNVPNVGPNAYSLGIVLYGGSGVYSTLGKIFPI